MALSLSVHRFAVLLLLCSQAASNYIRVLHVSYKDGTPEGHFDFGRQQGEAMGDVIQKAWHGDQQLVALEEWVETAEGKKVFEDLVNGSTKEFPLYSKEVEGMAAGAGVPLKRMFINQLREELMQWLNRRAPLPRIGHCTDAYAYFPARNISVIGHNDDWPVSWRNATYFVIATALDEDGTKAKFMFGTWVYPGYLPGEQLTWNSFGVAYTGNSLFPKTFYGDGVGTAWINRHMAEAFSVDELKRRAGHPLASTALNYNVADVKTGALENVEVQARGILTSKRVDGAYFHGNEFVLSDVAQFPEPSTQHRRQRWEQLRPSTVNDIRRFLADSTDPEYPVWRNGTAPEDHVFTEITGMFDLHRRRLVVWTSRPDGPQLMELPLDFASLSPTTTGEPRAGGGELPAAIISV